MQLGKSALSTFIAWPVTISGLLRPIGASFVRATRGRFVVIPGPITLPHSRHVIMSQQQEPSKAIPKHLREPPPALFLGPPSRNASHVSLPGLPSAIPSVVPPQTSALNPARPPLLRDRSQRTRDGRSDVKVGSSLLRTTLPTQQQEREGKKQADRTDALWAEMQGTLEEVELSAVNATHVFEPEHGKALDELRSAQIALAQAWARSAADGVVDGTDKENKGKGLTPGSEVKSVLDTMDSTAAASTRPGSSSSRPSVERIGSRLEEETESDILLARKRREDNDRYFHRVNAGVLDVVAKLEAVAAAMRAVEQESRDIWADTESAATSIHTE